MAWTHKQGSKPTRQQTNKEAIKQAITPTSSTSLMSAPKSPRLKANKKESTSANEHGDSRPTSQGAAHTMPLFARVSPTVAVNEEDLVQGVSHLGQKGKIAQGPSCEVRAARVVTKASHPRHEFRVHWFQTPPLSMSDF